jgi:hypothetical protein
LPERNVFPEHLVQCLAADGKIMRCADGRDDLIDKTFVVLWKNAETIARFIIETGV